MDKNRKLMFIYAIILIKSHISPSQKKLKIQFSQNILTGYANNRSMEFRAHKPPAPMLWECELFC